MAQPAPDGVRRNGHIQHTANRAFGHGDDEWDVVSTGVYATAANVRYLRAEVAQTRHTLVLPIAG